MEFVMVSLAQNSLLTLMLAAAAIADWRTRRVPLALMRGLLAMGVVMGLFRPEWPVALAAAIAAGVSSAPWIPRRLRIAACLFGGFALFAWGRADPNLAAGLAAVFAAWLLWELHYWGGADATIALGLVATFPSMEFVARMGVVLLLGSCAMTILRHRVRTPLVLLAALGDLRVLRIPDREGLESDGVSAVWMLAIAGVWQAWWGA